MNHIEAMKQALEALDAPTSPMLSIIQEDAATSLRQAVSEAENREWVGLTEDEITECFNITPDQYLPWQIYRRIETKLRSKNQ